MSVMSGSWCGSESMGLLRGAEICELVRDAVGACCGHSGVQCPQKP